MTLPPRTVVGCISRVVLPRTPVGWDRDLCPVRTGTSRRGDTLCGTRGRRGRKPPYRGPCVSCTSGPSHSPFVPAVVAPGDGYCRRRRARRRTTTLLRRTPPTPAIPPSPVVYWTDRTGSDSRRSGGVWSGKSPGLSDPRPRLTGVGVRDRDHRRLSGDPSHPDPKPPGTVSSVVTPTTPTGPPERVDGRGHRRGEEVSVPPPPGPRILSVGVYGGCLREDTDREGGSPGHRGGHGPVPGVL